MYPHLAHVFIDGGYLRAIARSKPGFLANPRLLAEKLAVSGPVQTWAYDPGVGTNAFLGRVVYYDALPPEGEKSPADLEDYWQAVELLQDVHLGFGTLKGLKKKVRQKGVDTLLAVDMLVGAFSSLFDIAILVGGDADFVPVVEEVKRRGVMVMLAASGASVADELRRACDRFLDLGVGDYLIPMTASGKTWPA
jgi:uncharacterized LabA/DUF88 family protein